MFFKSTQSADFLVIGLGNPGKNYDGTRHNIGFETIDYIAEKTATSIIKSKFNALYGVWQNGDKRVILLKPQTFMNLSGQSVVQAANYFKIPLENIIVLCDDVSLDVAKIRIRCKGSAGGHNGLKSIISHIGEDFLRIKIGVGQKPHPEYDLADWVLSKFSDNDKKKLSEKFSDIYKATKLLVENESQKAMNLYNS